MADTSRTSRLNLFGIRPKTRKQKQFMKIVIIIKTAVFLVIFALVIIFLWKLKALQ